MVFRATDLATGRPRAAKLLTTADTGAERRLRREAELLAGIDHPAIVPFRGLHLDLPTDLSGDGRRAMLITDWIHGESLLDRLRRCGPIPADQAADVLSAIADPLDHLHRCGVVHRDISPANVLRRPDGSLVLIDLGIGHFVDGSTLTNDDLLAGTPKYLAPEVIRGETATAAADQYGVAVMIHELITGRSPFPESHRVATALHHQLNSAPEPLDEIDPSLSTALSDAVLRALDKDPDRRFETMADFAAAARRPIANGGRRPSMVVLGVVGLIAVLAVAGLAVYNGGNDDSVVAGEQDRATPTTDSTDQAQLVVTVPDDELTNEGDTAEADRATGGDPSVDPNRWVEGTAATLDCNLLAGHGFENGSVPLDYFGNPPGRERVVETGGYENSWALEVGLADAYGQYGEIVTIEPGRSYLFRGWFDLVQPVADASLGVTFLSADYQPIDGTVSPTTTIDGAGFREVMAGPAPDGAALAVPFLFKDSSPGVLIADELVFGPTDDCQPQLADYREVNG